MGKKGQVASVALCVLSVFILPGDSCSLLAPSGLGTGGPTGQTTTPTPITAAITASKTSNINPGEIVVFTAANVSGGTPPYTYFWAMDHDANWTVTGNTFPATIDNSAQTRTVNLVVRDSNNTDSDYFYLEVTLADQGIPAVPTVCGDMGGTWSSVFGVMTVAQNGNNVAGTYDYFGCIGEINGDLSGGPSVSTACPDCLTWSGRWAETGPTCSTQQTGTFTFSVNPDLGYFNGTWTKDPNTHSQPDFWSGSHVKCADGSDAGPQQ